MKQICNSYTAPLLKICRKSEFLFVQSLFMWWFMDGSSMRFLFASLFFFVLFQVAEKCVSRSELFYRFLFYFLFYLFSFNLFFSSVMGKSREWVSQMNGKVKGYGQSCLCWWVVDGWLRLFWQIWHVMWMIWHELIIWLS